MANKQINAYTATPLADTDSLIKQSVTGLTARTTLADIKGNLDGRYAQKGTVVWEDEEGDTTIAVTLTPDRIYEFWIQTHISMSAVSPKAAAQIFRSYINSGALTVAYYKYFDGEEKQGFLSVGSGNITSSAPVIKIIDLGEPV